MNATTRPNFDSMPLWRLLVALHDAEQVAGPESQSAQALAAVVSRRLQGKGQRTSQEPSRTQLQEDDR